MRRTQWLFTLGLGIALLAVGLVKAQKKEVKPLTEAEARPVLMQVAQKIEKLSMSRDPEMFNKMAAQEFVDIDATGKVFNKQQEMEIVKSSDFKLESIKFTDVTNHFSGDTVVMVGTSTVKAQFQGKDMSGRYRFVQVLQRRPGTRGASTDDWSLLACFGVGGPQSPDIP